MIFEKYAGYLMSVVGEAYLNNSVSVTCHLQLQPCYCLSALKASHISVALTGLFSDLGVPV